MTKLTLEQIDELTADDVRQALEKLTTQRNARPEDRDRSGISTIDFTLSGVTGAPGRTLEDAKAYLRRLV